MDVHTKAQRSYNMSRIRSENTKPEIILFRMLSKEKIRFKKHVNLPGKPDVVINNKKIVLFMDGEFWHGRNFKIWKNKLSDFWANKISENIRRDRRNDKQLRKLGWKVLHVWDKTFKKNPDPIIQRVMRTIDRAKNTVSGGTE